MAGVTVTGLVKELFDEIWSITDILIPALPACFQNPIMLIIIYERNKKDCYAEKKRNPEGCVALGDISCNLPGNFVATQLARKIA